MIDVTFEQVLELAKQLPSDEQATSQPHRSISVIITESDSLKVNHGTS